jgi:hypothetical protein
VNPATTGSINNVAIGAVTSGPGRFTTLTLTTQPAGASSAVTFGYAAALATAYSIAMA